MADPVAAGALNPVPFARDARVMGLIGIAHGLSHFFHLIVAPLFPWLKADYGYSYAELGFVMTVFFLVSGCCQALAGFVVDRYGAGRTLMGGLACLSAGAACLGFSDSYAGLLLGAALAGLGNCVFHPVDFSLLNARVSVPRLGPAYSVHGLSGSLGWALAPVFLVGIADPFGWRSALFAAALLPLVMIAVLLLNRDVLFGNSGAPADDAERTGEPPESAPLLAFLREPKIWWCFGFFVFVSAAIGASQNFAPTIFGKLYAIDVPRAAMSVTTMMLGSALGMGFGGWLVLRSRRLERNISAALAFGVLSAIVIGLGAGTSGIALVLIGLMGFGIGLSGPSRDMLIRSATPPGATGRVYGVVYSGLDVGIAVAPVLFGGLLDHGFVAEVFYGIALCLAFAIVTAWRVGRGGMATA